MVPGRGSRLRQLHGASRPELIARKFAYGHSALRKEPPKRELRGFFMSGMLKFLLLRRRPEIERWWLHLRNVDLDRIGIDRRQRTLVVHDHRRKHDDEQHDGDLDDDDGQSAPIDLTAGASIH